MLGVHPTDSLVLNPGQGPLEPILTSFLPLKGLAASVFSNIQMRSDDLPPVMDLSMSCFSG